MIYTYREKNQNRCVMVSKSIKFDVKNDGCDFQVGKPFSCQNANHLISRSFNSQIK